MNEIETKELVFGQKEKVFTLVPKSLNEAIELAKIISESDLAPKDFKGKPGNTLIAMQMGAEIGISPMQSIQNIAVINGRPSIYGDMGKALLLQHGCRIEERDMKEVKELGEGWCRITRPDGSQPTVRTFSIEDAKTAQLWGKQGPWTNAPYRMLAWRAFWFAARDAAADYLKGLAGAEEVRDYVETEIVKSEPIKAPKSLKEKETVNKKTGEIGYEDGENNTEPEDFNQDSGNGAKDAIIAAKPPVPHGGKEMSSKREGRCESCGKDILIADKIVYFADRGRASHRSHFQ